VAAASGLWTLVPLTVCSVALSLGISVVLRQWSLLAGLALVAGTFAFGSRVDWWSVATPSYSAWVLFFTAGLISLVAYAARGSVATPGAAAA
jgi:hypothetical protein